MTMLNTFDKKIPFYGDGDIERVAITDGSIDIQDSTILGEKSTTGGKSDSMRNYERYLDGKEPLENAFVTHKEGDDMFDLVKNSNVTTKTFNKKAPLYSDEVAIKNKKRSVGYPIPSEDTDKDKPDTKAEVQKQTVNEKFNVYAIINNILEKDKSSFNELTDAILESKSKKHKRKLGVKEKPTSERTDVEDIRKRSSLWNLLPSGFDYLYDIINDKDEKHNIETSTPVHVPPQPVNERINTDNILDTNIPFFDGHSSTPSIAMAEDSTDKLVQGGKKPEARGFVALMDDSTLETREQDINAQNVDIQQRPQEQEVNEESTASNIICGTLVKPIPFFDDTYAICEGTHGKQTTRGKSPAIATPEDSKDKWVQGDTKPRDKGFVALMDDNGAYNKTPSMKNYENYVNGKEPLANAFVMHKEGDDVFDFIKKKAKRRLWQIKPNEWDELQKENMRGE